MCATVHLKEVSMKEGEFEGIPMSLSTSWLSIRRRKCWFVSLCFRPLLQTDACLRLVQASPEWITLDNLSKQYLGVSRMLRYVWSKPSIIELWWEIGIRPVSFIGHAEYPPDTSVQNEYNGFHRVRLLPISQLRLGVVPKYICIQTTIWKDTEITLVTFSDVFPTWWLKDEPNRYYIDGWVLSF